MPDAKRQKFDDSKRKFLQSEGLLLVKKECEWNREKVYLPSPNKYFDIYKKDGTEGTILNGIKNNTLFGFVKVSVKSPDDFIEKYRHLNFPPLIHNFMIDEEHLSPYMSNRVKVFNKKFPVRSLGQTFNAESLWLFTPLAQFYLTLGLELYNVESFIQFEGSNCLEIFKNTVTSMRMDADREKNPEKSTTAKLVGNS